MTKSSSVPKTAAAIMCAAGRPTTTNAQPTAVAARGLSAGARRMKNATVSTDAFLYDAGLQAGVSLEVVHRACDQDLVAVPMDDALPHAG